MKNKNHNRSKKSLTDSIEGFGGIRKGLVDAKQHLLGSKHAEFDTKRGILDTKHAEFDTKHIQFDAKHGILDTKHGILDTKNAVLGSKYVRKSVKNEQFIILPIILMSQIDVDYIPGPDGDFDEWQKNYVKHLSSPWPPPEEGAPAPAGPATLLYVYLGIAEDRYKELIEMQKLWTKDFARGGKKTDRRTSEMKAKQATRKKYVKLLRSITAEYIHSNRKADDEIKSALKLTVPDTEPTPIHGTDAPVVGLKNAGGSVIAFRCRRDEDQTRASMIKGYLVEVRSWALDKTESAPSDPDVTGYKEDLSSKSHFKVKCGMANLGKTFYCYVRWRSKTNSAFDSPWTNRLQIVIA